MLPNAPIIYRDYQNLAIQSIWQYFLNGGLGSPLVAMPTGTGKSIVIAGFIKSVYEYYPTSSIMVLTHVKELIEQNFEKLLRIWPNAPCGIYSAGLKRKDRYCNITFGGIGSVVKKPELFGKIDLILIDESHLVSPSDNTMYRKFLNALMLVNPNLKVIGFTATPYRLGQGMLIEEGGLFTDICCDMTGVEWFNWFINEGYLIPLTPKRTQLSLDVDGVRMSGGEFMPKELQLAVDKYELTESAVKEALEKGDDRKKWLVFTSGVEHTIHTNEMLNDYGVISSAVFSSNKDYKMSQEERNRNIDRFKQDPAQRALVNNNILTTGFDVPSIDLILNLRPTSSPGLWVQMLGRGTRPDYAPGFDLETTYGRLQAIENSDKQNCLVLDFGGNAKRLGPINDPVLPRPKGKKKGTAPIKLCEGITADNQVCDTWIHASLKTCPECGNEFTFETKLLLKASEQEIIKQDNPVTEEFKVDHITYAKNIKKNSPVSLKVTYHSGLRRFMEHICIEHTGPAKNRARRWWAARTDLEMPINVANALVLTNSLKPATSIRVWTNKKYPEILAYDFEGTHFGKEEKQDKIPGSQTFL